MELELAIRLEADRDLIDDRHKAVWMPWVNRYVDELAPGLVETLDGRAAVIGWTVRAFLG